MVKAFKTEQKETLYAISGRFKNREEILKELAKFKKESLNSVKSKFKKFKPGYYIQNKNVIELYEGRTSDKNATACVIVRK